MPAKDSESKSIFAQSETPEETAVWDKMTSIHIPYFSGLYRLVGMMADCYISISFIFVIALIRAAIDNFKAWIKSFSLTAEEKAAAEEPAANAIKGFLAFYTKYLYNTMADCFDSPILGAAATTITVCSREWTVDHGVDRLRVIKNGPTRKCLNLGSYNYLGFGGPNEVTVPAVEQSLRDSGIMLGSNAQEMGISLEQRELEETIAAFLGKEDAIVCPMGFGTNSLLIPALAGKGSLFLSDGLNHSSIITGLRTSGAKIRVVKHSDTVDLERQLIIAVNERPRWERIIFACEGIYSMEGEICPLPDIVRICHKYGALVFMDEAHSIGAIGPNGRGACDYYGLDYKDVDVHMGTFTKSFGSVGGYVCGPRNFIAHIRRCALAPYLGVTFSPASAKQATEALRALDRPEGKARIAALRRNSMTFRKALIEAGCELLGPCDSPVIPVMVRHAFKMCALPRAALKAGLATVIVGYPATPLMETRVRLCISAGFTEQEVDDACKALVRIVKDVNIDYIPPSRRIYPNEPKNYCSKIAEGDMPTLDKSLPPFQSKSIADICDESSEKNSHTIRVLDFGKLAGKTLLSVYDYLGLANNKDVIQASCDVVKTYGVGSCGPRGFYGSTDLHIALEEDLARWLNAEAAILYSYGALTVTSVLPTFVNEPEDILVYDESLGLSGQIAVRLTKGRKVSYPHNDMEALEKILADIAAKETSAQKKKGRHLLFAEAVSYTSGDIAPLPRLVELKHKYKYMLALDETHSIACMGSTGRGLAQYYDELPGSTTHLTEDKTAVDLRIGSLENALGSIGGFCVGPRNLIQYQVLSGLGYVFSASSPPYLCRVASMAIAQLENEDFAKQAVAKLRSSLETLRSAAESSDFASLYELSNSNRDSPFFYAHLKTPLESAEKELEVLEAVEEESFKEGTAPVCVARFASRDTSAPKRPALRFVASAAQDKIAVERAFEMIVQSTRSKLEKL